MLIYLNRAEHQRGRLDAEIRHHDWFLAVDDDLIGPNLDRTLDIDGPRDPRDRERPGRDDLARGGALVDFIAFHLKNNLRIIFRFERAIHVLIQAAFSGFEFLYRDDDLQILDQTAFDFFIQS